jgi:flagellar motor switch protein FliN
MVTETLAPARDALATFLTTLLGEDNPFTLDFGDTEPTAEAAAHLESGLVLAAESGTTRIALSIDEGYLSLLSQAMLGDTLKPGDEGADDLLKELAAQAFGAVRSSLSGIGHKLPDLTFAPTTSDEAVATLGTEVAVVRAEYQSSSGPLQAVALIAQMASPEPEPPSRPTMSSQRSSSVNVAPAAFPELGIEALSSGDGAAFGLLAEVELEVTVELGRRRLALADVLRLTTGSVIELEKLVGEPLQVYANNRLIAEGEAVVIDEQFGIRITNLISSARRTKAFI